MGTVENHVGQTCAPHARPAQGGVGQIGVMQIGAAEIGPDQLAFAQALIAQVSFWSQACAARNDK